MVSCDQCGNTFFREKQVVERNEKTFCDWECQGNWRSENYTGEDNPLYTRVDKTCEWCGGVYTVKKKREDTTRFCSQECLGKWNSRNLEGHENWASGFSEGEENIRWNSIEVECSYCGETHMRAKSKVEDKNNVFCDIDCHASYQSEYIVGENHPLSKNGEKISARPSKKKEIRSRDNWKCQYCGMDNEKHKEKYKGELDVHHIIPARKFSDRERANDPSNLITLCKDCHRTWEKMAGLKPQVIS